MLFLLTPGARWGWGAGSPRKGEWGAQSWSTSCDEAAGPGEEGAGPSTHAAWSGGGPGQGAEAPLNRLSSLGTPRSPE